jgi:diguanylate cyclase (GGDEF)-like protein
MGTRILLVDGCAEYRKVVAAALAELGHEVDEAGDAASGIARVRAAAPRVVMVDSVLPDGGGMELLDRIRALGFHPRACIVTGPDGDPAAACADRGDLRVLRGPVHPMRLVREVDALADSPSSTAPPASPSARPSRVSLISVATADSIGKPRSSDNPLAEIRRAYAAKLPTEIANLARAVAGARDESEAGALAEAHRLSHSMHGTAGTLGFAQISAAAREIEDLLHPARLIAADPDPDLWARVGDALARIRSAPAEAASLSSVAPRAALIATVLVADPDPAVLASFRAMGQRSLVRVVTARNELEALSQARQLKLDGAIIDTDLGREEETFDIGRRLRSLEGLTELPLAIMSNDSSITNRVAAAHAGASLFLRKPVDDADLTEAVRHFLSFSAAEKPRVLVLDDDLDFAAFLAGILTQERIEVATISDPGRILDALESERPDIVLLDVNMPGVSGLDVCRMLRSTAAHRDLPVLFLTAETSTAARVACFEAGGDDYIEKPIVREELLARINVRMDRVRFYRQRADRDGLTNLYTRRAFVEALQARLSEAERRDRPVAVCLVDIDHFKSVNDSFGHLAGDRVLAALGRLLSSRFRASDVRGRWGGEEFVLALYGEEPETARMVVARVLDEFRRMVFDGDHGESFNVSFSGGVASFPIDGRSIDELLRAADARLYEAKERGRSRVEM